MKIIIVTIGLCVVYCGHAVGQTNQIVTRFGDVYKNVTIERHDASGLTISYAMPGGGFGITKLAFANLPDDLQKKYNYDPQQAALYQAGEKQAAADWGAKMDADEKYGAVIRAQREKEIADEAAAEAAAKAAAEEQAKQDALREREVAAKEKEADKPPVQMQQNNQTIVGY
jgi:hypothetical protein